MNRIRSIRFAILAGLLAGLLADSAAPAPILAADPGRPSNANPDPFAGKPRAARYAKEVNEELIVKWSTLVQDNVNMLFPSTVRLKFRVEKSGAIQNVRITFATPKAKLAVDIAKQVMQSARLKPFSAELVREIGSSMDFEDFAFTLQ